jgi:hypothetical protein
VTAVDLSLSSLAYARRMAHELSVTNVEFGKPTSSSWPDGLSLSISSIASVF